MDKTLVTTHLHVYQMQLQLLQAQAVISWPPLAILAPALTSLHQVSELLRLGSQVLQPQTPFPELQWLLHT